MASLWLNKIHRISNLSGFYHSIMIASLRVSHRVPTAAVVGSLIYINPFYISRLSNYEVKTIITHEIDQLILQFKLDTLH